MIKTSVKTYGVQEGCINGNVRYFCMCNGERTSLHYAKEEFAINKAYIFCRSCYKDFVRSNGTEIKFIFMRIR